MKCDDRIILWGHNRVSIRGEKKNQIAFNQITEKGVNIYSNTLDDEEYHSKLNSEKNVITENLLLKNPEE